LEPLLHPHEKPPTLPFRLGSPMARKVAKEKGLALLCKSSIAPSILANALFGLPINSSFVIRTNVIPNFSIFSYLSYCTFSDRVHREHSRPIQLPTLILDYRSQLHIDQQNIVLKICKQTAFFVNTSKGAFRSGAYSFFEVCVFLFRIFY